MSLWLGAGKLRFFAVPPMNKNYPSIVMRTTQIPFRATVLLGMACVFLPCLSSGAAEPLAPLGGSKQALTVKFEIKNPKTATNDEFIAVRQRLSAIDAETKGAAEDHPMREVDCGACHINDKIAKDHFDVAINESEPARSCDKAGCHDLTTAGKMPFWMKPYASLDKAGKFTDVAKLLGYAASVRSDLSARTGGLPAFDEVKIDVEALDKGIYRLKEEPIPFFHAQSADLLDEKNVKRLVAPLFDPLDRAVNVPTLMELVMEAKVRRASDLPWHAGLGAQLPADLNVLRKESKAELKYKPGVLPPAAGDLLLAEVAARFPAAKLKTDTPLKKEWEIPSGAEQPKKATIKLEIKTGENEFEGKESKIEFKDIADSQIESVFEVLAKIQAAHPEVANEFAKYELKFEALSAANKATLLQAAQGLAALPASGDLKWSLKNKADGKGATPTPEELTALARMRIAAHPMAVRKLKSEIKYTGDLSAKETNTEVIYAAPPRVTVTAKQATVAEGGAGKLVFTLTREAETPLDKPLVVHYTLGGTARAGKDYAKPKLRATIPKGAASVDVAVKVTNDRAAEGAETVVLFVAAKNEYTVPDPTGATVTILDDERP
jgi:hypothetical protein